MKKTLIIFALLAFISCSKEDVDECECNVYQKQLLGDDEFMIPWSNVIDPDNAYGLYDLLTPLELTRQVPCSYNREFIRTKSFPSGTVERYEHTYRCE